MSNDIRKKNTGEPGNGGEWGSHKRSDADEGLLAAETPAVSEVFTLRKASKNGVFRVDNDVTDPPAVRDGAFMTKMVHIGGQPHSNARLKTIAAIGYPEEDRAWASETSVELAAVESKMTVLTMNVRGHAEVREGTGIVYGGKPMLRSKGSNTRGHYLADLQVVDVMAGYGKGQKLIDRYNLNADAVPSVGPITLDGIPADTGDGDPSDDIAAVFLIDSPDFGHGATPGCLFLATDVQMGDTPQTTVVNGYFWAPDGADAVSEHGSFYQADLFNRGGRVNDYTPGSLKFSGAMGGGLGSSYQTAFQAVRG